MTSKPSCLIIDELHPSIFKMLEDIGMRADYRPDIQPSEVAESLVGFDGLIVRSKMRITADTLVYADKLKFVARAGAGLDNIDAVALEERGIILFGANEGNSQAVGEYTLGLLLSLLRHTIRADRQVRGKIWLREENRGEELSGKTVGIIGYGNMGQSFARVLRGFGCRMLAYDRYSPEKVCSLAASATLNQIQEEADIISLHIPFTPENRYFADASFFEGFRKRIWFINTSRGEVVDQAALVQQLKEHRLKGAALDVLENEKLQTLTAVQLQNFNYLASSGNVILTPHIAGWTHESYIKINEVLVEKIKQLDIPF